MAQPPKAPQRDPSWSNISQTRKSLSKSREPLHDSIVKIDKKRDQSQVSERFANFVSQDNDENNSKQKSRDGSK